MVSTQPTYYLCILVVLSLHRQKIGRLVVAHVPDSNQILQGYYFRKSRKPCQANLAKLSKAKQSPLLCLSDSKCVERWLKWPYCISCGRLVWLLSESNGWTSCQLNQLQSISTSTLESVQQPDYIHTTYIITDCLNIIDWQEHYM